MKASYILDSSALLAWMFDEPGKERVSAVLKKGCVMSSVNWAEVIQKASDHGVSAQLLYERLRQKQIMNIVLHVLDHTEELAVRAGELFQMTKQSGLSMGDLSCLALAQRRKLPIMTADRVWKSLEEKLALEVKVIR